MTIETSESIEQARARLLPKAPRDDCTFEQLELGYNFRQTSDWVALFVRLLVKECEQVGGAACALDIGCGVGTGRQPEFTRLVHQRVEELWGIEPDPSAIPPDGLFSHHQHATLEAAKLPEAYFDLAYSFMVLEHVADPDAFFEALARCLKPGGTFFFVTVNASHYFSRAAKLLSVLKLEETVLRLLRGRTVDEYHYPVHYRINSRKQLSAVARRSGFEEPELVYVEEDGPKPYFPGPLKPLWWIFQQKRRVIHRPEQLLTLYGRMRRVRD